MNKKYLIFANIFFFLLFLAIACERNGKKQEVIASVNDSNIYLIEFQKEISILSKRNPAFKITPQIVEEQLNTAIDKKLMLQEAMEKGLIEDQRFVETIKTFWEQTLIRELIESKSKEWAGRLFVTEEEIKTHYQRMQYMPVIRIAKSKDKEQAENIKEKIIKRLKVDNEETIGPLLIEDVRSEAILHAFDMSDGTTDLYEANGEYIVMQIIKKDKVSVPPFKDSYERIKSILLEGKKQKAMEEWLKQIRNSSKITINTELLKGISYEK